MKIHTMDQGGPEWLRVRLGIPTASRFDDLLTPRTRKPSAGQERYLAELLAEYLMGQPLDWRSLQVFQGMDTSTRNDPSYATFADRGRDLEAEARAWYEMMTGRDVQEVGFVTRDDGLVGCSPDGLVVGASRGLEIKCYGAGKHMGIVLAEDVTEHIGQTQGGMLICERDEWDVLYFHPDLPKRIVRTTRDEAWTSAFVPQLDAFLERLEAHKERYAMDRIIRPWDPEMVEAMREANDERRSA